MAGKALSPFDEAKYLALLEGLEVSIINFEFYNNTYRKRLDSEFYLKFFLKNEIYLTGSSLKSYLKNECIKNVKSFSLNKNFNYLPIAGVHLNSLDYTTENIDYLSIPDRATYCLKENDIVVSTVRPNRNAVAFIKKSKRLVGTSGFTVIRIDENLVNQYFVYSFLKTKFFITKMMRENTATMYPAVTDYDVLNLKIPVPSKAFQNKIEALVKQAHKNLDRSKTLYQEAEQILLEEVGLQDFTPSQEKISIKNFSESFGSSGRLDAEYYQPFYEEIEFILKRKGFSLLKDICSEINYGTVPTSPYTEDGSGIPYIKGLNLKNTEIRKDKLDRIVNTENLHIRYYTKRGDIIVSQMGTVGDVGVIREEENWLFASFTIRARIRNFEKFNPYFVGLYIQNIAKKYYLYRNIAQASVRQNTDLPTIKNLYIPNIPIERQTQIAEKIAESFALKKESEALLQKAKQAVELAIEKGEKAALEMLG